MKEKQTIAKNNNQQLSNRKETNMSTNETNNPNPDNRENNRQSKTDIRIAAFLQYADGLENHSFDADGKRDPQGPIKYYRVAADLGCPAAQYELGFCYLMGDGVKQNLKMAARLFRKAAEQGHPAAQYQMGNCCYLGEGVKENRAKAIEWYLKAAERGNSDAMDALAGEDLSVIE